MERIQQAIERARQQRATRVQQARGGTLPTTVEASSLDGCPTFAIDPRHAQAHRLIAALPDDGRSDLFRMLRTQLRQRLAVLGGRSVAVVSARDREGKTMVACNLAVSLARQDAGPVFLLDFDFRRPSVHEMFGIKVEHGLSAYIEGLVPLAAVAHRVADLPLFVLPQGRRHAAASELIAAQATRNLIAALRDKVANGAIVIDCSPLLLTDEPLSVQQIVDACLLVVQQGRTRRDEIRRAAELIDESKYIGSVMNRVRDADVQQEYGYGYR